MAPGDARHALDGLVDPGFVAGQPLPSMYQDSGWGLYLVEQIADRWGVTQDDGTCVWFELDR